ncbi:hypothetical protein [Georgenia sp. H159]|uniref:hypothetical protein n=1 Tax=Georgenia sp. H159 TaxID=3076115 RepID=UPI002D7693CC|nr:hypothetical protein [Georgenia sp. H159]
MAVTLGRSSPLPRVILSSDLGANAVREAHGVGLVQVCRGAFVEPLADAPDWATAEHLATARVAAAARRLRSGTTFSHESAALVHGLWLLHAPDVVHVTQRSKPRRQSAGLRRHTGELAPSDVTEVNGLTVTTVERTIADCAKTMHPRDALVVVDSGMRLLLAPRRDQRALTMQRAEGLRDRVLGLVESGPIHGRRQARAVVAHADPYAESPYETVIRWIAVSRGLPRPILQARFQVRGRTYYTDMCWLFELPGDGLDFRLRLLGEYDGELKYLGDAPSASVTPAATSRRMIDEKRREDDLRSMPRTSMVRFDRRDVSREEQAFRRLCAVLPAPYVARLEPIPALLGRLAAQ